MHFLISMVIFSIFAYVALAMYAAHVASGHFDKKLLASNGIWGLSVCAAAPAVSVILLPLALELEWGWVSALMYSGSTVLAGMAIAVGVRCGRKMRIREEGRKA